jgi:hypothetical protein
MKSDFIEFIGNARKRRSETFRKQTYIFVVCLVLSIFIWALVRLSRDYYHSLEYRLIYTHVPSSLGLEACSDTTLTLRIRLQGFEFFSEQYFVRQYREYEVSLRNVRLRYSGEKATGYLLTNRIGREIISQSNFPNDVYFVSPDTLFFLFERNRTSGEARKRDTNAVRIEIAGRDTVIRVTDSMKQLRESSKGDIKLK